MLTTHVAGPLLSTLNLHIISVSQPWEEVLAGLCFIENLQLRDSKWFAQSHTAPTPV